ncbi:Maf family protein [Marimonas lutisalis]|uniref:Maf family protein n=1 Tax=Marimonas lutisalis TaxID=2545756 RepID=UPI0010F61ACE|nr:nucleoside triphosphate pyrophosphatase [Marimonas lutisalis]
MPRPIILASGSEIRQQLLRNAGVPFSVSVARIDEDSIRKAMLADGAPPRDIADALAEGKAEKISRKNPEALVIGCDQVLEHRGTILSKPENPEDARAQLKRLRGDRHSLLSAAVIYHEGQPIWRHIGQVRLQMRDFSDAYLDGYIARNWDSIRHAVGGYKLEEEGVRLFARIDGDYFNVLGLPLVEILSYLSTTGDIEA